MQQVMILLDSEAVAYYFKRRAGETGVAYQALIDHHRKECAAPGEHLSKSVFKGAKVGRYSYWGKNPMGIKEGSVLTAHLTLLGQKLMLLNGFMKMPFNWNTPRNTKRKEAMMAAMWMMKKLDIKKLKAAFDNA